MIKEFVKAWDKNKSSLEDWFIKTKMDYDYTEILKKVIELVINPELESYYAIDLNRLVVIDHGNYQGTTIYIFVSGEYQPHVRDYYYTDNYYGSCSGCDTLESIKNYDYDLPNEYQVKDLMQLALGLIQKMKKMEE